MRKNLFSISKLVWGLFAFMMVLALIQSCKKEDDPVVIPVDKSKLKARLDSANAGYALAVEGTGVGQFEAGSKAVFKTAIDAATAVNNDAAATQTAVNNAYVNLGQAGATFLSKMVQEIAPANLVAYYKFDGNANDGSGKGNNGTLKAGSPLWGAGVVTPTKDRFGADAKAYHFDKGGNIEVPYNSSLNPAKEIAISMWVKYDSSRASNYLLALNRWNGYKVQLQEANKVFFTVKTTAGAKDKDDETVTLDKGKWYHIAVTYKSGDMSFYIDGTLIKTYTDVTGDLAPVKNTINMTIGQDLPTSLYNKNEKDDADGNNFNGPWGGYFTGDMDDIRIYNVALSSTQVKSIYTAEKGK
ncbi:hypothetical protein GCM10028803_57680 [Larkinella knui]|uniref:LamG domain-containing protein n=1 Tax=Larkinella knui TaxID=2025310 RepID=A0A3P1CHF2_9BACT|nr:LamG domain-containing protein [Larkinella knui]RRB12793.1 LamG domain-containing protein [Larkinella knui]